MCGSSRKDRKEGTYRDGLDVCFGVLVFCFLRGDGPHGLLVLTALPQGVQVYPKASSVQ